MGDYTKYGMCGGSCKKWVRRNDMLSINISVYDNDNVEEKIRMRFCQRCHVEARDGFRNHEWVNDLKYEIEIKADPELAANSDLEYDKDAHLRVDGVLDGDDGFKASEVFSPKITDDSEAAMRRSGKIVDKRY